MARIPQTVIDDIRERSNIVDIVGQYVQLKKSGKIILVCVRSIMKNHLLFPLQRTNKFFIALVVVVVEMYGFLQELEGISFPEAVVKVAEMNDIPLDPQYQQSEGINEATSQTSQLIALHEKPPKSIITCW